MQHSSRGFTLIELLVVIAIIGILSSVVLSSLNVARNRANDAHRRSDVGQLIRAINNYYNTTGSLPRTDSWCNFISNPSGGAGASFQADIVPTYISKIPLDPTRAGAPGDYFYANQNDNSGRFTVCAVLETDPNTVEPDFTVCPGWSTAYNHCVSQ